jgi:saxitoxin biosynthesis operon SxtJ-like protein
MASHWSALGEVYVPPPTAPSHRKFGMTVGAVLIAIALFSAWRGHVIRAEVTVGIAALLIVAALVRPSSLGGVAAIWTRIGHALGWFNSRVLLTFLFFVVLSPIGFVSRLFGSDPLDSRRRSRSFWSDYPSRMRDPKHYEHLF